MKLTHLDLFSGIAGFALASEWAGFETVGFCDIEPFSQQILKRRFNGQVVTDTEGGGRDVRGETGHLGKEKGQEGEGRDKPAQAIGDSPQSTTSDTTGKDGRRSIQERKRGEETIGGEGSYRIPIFPDIRKLDGTQFRGITLLTGGFPCQPFSVAGKREGKEDDRHLWPAMLRIISEARPTWVIGENVGGIISFFEQDGELELENREYTEDEMRAEAKVLEEVYERERRGILDEIICDLENIGYEVQPFVIPACAVNAPHRRDRIWIVAHSKRAGTWGECGETPNERGRSCENWGEGIRQENREIGTGGTDTANRNVSENAPYPVGSRNGRWDNGDPSELQRTLQIKGSDREYPTGTTSDTNGSGSGTPGCGTDGIGKEKDERWGEQSFLEHCRQSSDSLAGVAPHTDNGGQPPNIREEVSGREGPAFPNTEPCDRDRRGGSLFSTVQDDPDTRIEGLEGREPTEPLRHCGQFDRNRCYEGWGWDKNWVEIASEFCRVDDELPVELDGLKLSKSKHREERLKALGNAIVPAVVFPIMQAIAEIELARENPAVGDDLPKKETTEKENGIPPVEIGLESLF